MTFRIATPLLLLAASGLAACSTVNLGVSTPIGRGVGVGVGVGVGTDGRVGVGVGISVGSGTVSVGTSGQLPVKKEDHNAENK